MNNTTMLKLKVKIDVGSVIRYKDFVLATEFVACPSGEWFEVTVWRPLESEEETGKDFMHIQLENVTEWEGQHFVTEGEALRAGMDFIEWKF